VTVLTFSLQIAAQQPGQAAWGTRLLHAIAAPMCDAFTAAEEGSAPHLVALGLQVLNCAEALGSACSSSSSSSSSSKSVTSAPAVLHNTGFPALLTLMLGLCNSMLPSCAKVLQQAQEEQYAADAVVRVCMYLQHHFTAPAGSGQAALGTDPNNAGAGIRRDMQVYVFLVVPDRHGMRL